MASLQLPQLEGTARAMGNSFGAMVPAQRTGEAFCFGGRGIPFSLLNAWDQQEGSRPSVCPGPHYQLFSPMTVE